MVTVQREMTIPVAAELLGISLRHTKRLLTQHASTFDPPTYRRNGAHPRLHRFLTARDMRVLNALIPRKTGGVIHGHPGKTHPGKQAAPRDSRVKKIM